MPFTLLVKILPLLVVLAFDQPSTQVLDVWELLISARNWSSEGIRHALFTL